MCLRALWSSTVIWEFALVFWGCEADRNVPQIASLFFGARETEEDLLEKIYEVGRSLGVELIQEDLSIAHRLTKPNKNGIRPVVAEITIRMKKNRLVRNSKSRKLQNGIAVYNHSTSRTYELFDQARELRNEGLVKFVWESDCKILVRKDENSPAIRITNEFQLNQFKQDSGNSTKSGGKTTTKSSSSSDENDRRRALRTRKVNKK